MPGEISAESPVEKARQKRFGLPVLFSRTSVCPMMSAASLAIRGRSQNSTLSPLYEAHPHNP
jgi:hypothetical protein